MGTEEGLCNKAPEHCKVIFQNIKRWEPNLDSFAEIMLRYSFDSYKGQSYRMPKERVLIENFVSIDALKEHARERLKDNAVSYPLKAVWRAVIEEKSIYAKDGSFKQN